MRSWKEPLRELFQGATAPVDEASARLAMLELLRRAQKVKPFRFVPSGLCLLPSRKLAWGDALCIPYLFHVDRHLRARNYMLAVHELEDVLYYMCSFGMLRNIILTLEAGLDEKMAAKENACSFGCK